MAEDQENAPMLEGVGEPAREKTLGERPVSDRDIEQIHDHIEDLQGDLADLRTKGDQTLQPPA